MAYRMPEISVLRATSYSKFKTKVRASIATHGGQLKHIAQDLDVGVTTLKRWFNEDDSLEQFAQRTRTRARAAKKK